MSPLPYQSKFYISSLDELTRFAERLSVQLQPGDVVALNGNLGAGKTTLVQKLGYALGLQETISSPTFVLMHEYHSGAYAVVHVDLYRLGDERADTLSGELLSLIDEGQSLVLVEWACYGAFLQPLVTVAIDITFVDDEKQPVEGSYEGRVIVLSSDRPLIEAP